ncbi:MAG: RNA-directed DNA polymerase [Phycisphaeraceae bacterium]|nr:RNA-directed DNA polymerase [Phycisphaerales bacterium]MCB9860217.1 RNA-directed DNA polymerase [Phycisphaeraceae bacterium]
MRAEPPVVRYNRSLQISTLDQVAGWVGVELSPLSDTINRASTMYSCFEIKKPNGGSRTIRPPNKVLRTLQHNILRELQSMVRYPRWMMGGIPRRSIFLHAGPHVAKRMVATFDVKSFYPSTNSCLVRSVLERLGFSGEALDAMVQILIKDDELPQGGPASGLIANLALEPADRRIDAICRKHDLRFTRYVDDIAISGEHDLRVYQGAIIDAIGLCGYEVAPDKIKFMGKEQCQVITKLVVNEQLRPSKSFIFEVKAKIRECLANGAFVVAVEHGISVPQLKSKLNGKVSHIKQADQRLGKSLQRKLNGVNWSRQLPD